MDLMKPKEKLEVEENLAVVGKKKAVLIGLKHPRINTDHIKGQILRMKKQLIELRGFSEDNITLMTEDEPSSFHPIASNIYIALGALVFYAHPDDTLFIYLIAHGCHPGMIVTSDKKDLSDGFFERLLDDRHCTLTFVSDCQIEPAGKPMCCNLPTEEEQLDTWNGELIRQILKRDQNAIMMDCCGCAPRNSRLVRILEDEKNEDVKSLDQESDDSVTPLWCIPHERSNLDHIHATLLMAFNAGRLFSPPPEVASSRTTSLPSAECTLYGGFTNIILDVMEETHGQVTNLELAQKAMEKLKMQGIHKKPGLSCNNHQHAYDSFVC